MRGRSGERDVHRAPRDWPAQALGDPCVSEGTLYVHARLGEVRPAFEVQRHDRGVGERLCNTDRLRSRKSQMRRTYFRNARGSSEQQRDVGREAASHFRNPVVPHRISGNVDSTIGDVGKGHLEADDGTAIAVGRPVSGWRGRDAQSPTVARGHLVTLPGQQSNRAGTNAAGPRRRCDDLVRRVEDLVSGAIEVVD